MPQGRDDRMGVNEQEQKEKLPWNKSQSVREDIHTIYLEQLEKKTTS